MAKKNSGWGMFLGILALVGGLVHTLEPLGINLLSFFGGISSWVQFVAGAATLWFVGSKLNK